MSLAGDILKKANIISPPKKIRKVKSKDLHEVRVPGTYYRNGKWESVVFYKNVTLTIGCFTNPSRAIMARKLWLMWREKGFKPNEIPKGPKREPYSRGKW